MLKWREGEIEIVTKDGGRAQVKALVSPDGCWAYHKLRGRFTLSHAPSGFAVWHQREPFAYRLLARELASLPRSDWSFTDPAVLSGTRFAQAVLARIMAWVAAGKLRGKVVQRG